MHLTLWSCFFISSIDAFTSKRSIVSIRRSHLGVKVDDDGRGGFLDVFLKPVVDDQGLILADAQV